MSRFPWRTIVATSEQSKRCRWRAIARGPGSAMLETVTSAQWERFDTHGFVSLQAPKQKHAQCRHFTEEPWSQCSLGVALAPAELAALSDRIDGIMMAEVVAEKEGYSYDRLLMQLQDGGQTRGHKGPSLE